MAAFVTEYLENALADATLEDIASQTFIPRANLALRTSQIGETSRLIAPADATASSRTLTDRLRSLATRAQENIQNFGSSRTPLKPYESVYRSTTQDLNPVYDAAGGSSSSEDVLYNKGYNRVPNSDKYNGFSSSSESTRSVPLRESVLRNNVANNLNRNAFSIGGETSGGSDLELQPLTRQRGASANLNETSFGRGSPRQVTRLPRSVTSTTRGLSQRIRNLGSRVSQSINRNVRSVRNSLRGRVENTSRGVNRGRTVNSETSSSARSSGSNSSTRPKRIVRRPLNQRPRSLSTNRLTPIENSGRYAWDNTGMGSDSYFDNSDSDVNRGLLPKRTSSVSRNRVNTSRRGRGFRRGNGNRINNRLSGSSGLTDAVLGPLLYSSVFGDRR